MGELVFRPQRHRRRVSLNLTSLIDVLFLLLIFFMLTSTFRRQGEMRIELPESSTSEVRSRGEQVPPAEVVLRADGQVSLDGEVLVGDDALLSALRARAQREPEGRAVVNAEPAARHADVVRLIDLVREAGFAGLSLGTEIRGSRGPAGGER